ncbi:MAG: hypothetical protein ACKOFX_06330, partial [Solirubrobacterales bacterium]
MPHLKGNIRAGAIALAVLGAVFLSACSGSGSGSSTSSAPPASDFPKVEGRTIEEVFASEPESEYVVSPAGLTFERGTNRYAFGVF